MAQVKSKDGSNDTTANGNSGNAAASPSAATTTDNEPRRKLVRSKERQENDADVHKVPGSASSPGAVPKTVDMAALMRARPSITLGGLPSTNDSTVDEREESSNEDESTGVPQATRIDGGEGADAPPSKSEADTPQDSAIADEEETGDPESTAGKAKDDETAEGGPTEGGPAVGGPAEGETPSEPTAATETSKRLGIANVGNEDGAAGGEGQAEAATPQESQTPEAQAGDGHGGASQVTAAAEQCDSGTDVTTPMSAAEGVEPDAEKADAGRSADTNRALALDSGVEDSSKVISFSFPEPPAPPATSASTAAADDSEEDE